jgi:uncharacterized membrane protein
VSAWKAFVYAIAFLVIAAGLGTNAAVARGGYQVCNRTSEKLFLAIAYYTGNKDFFVSEGWWTLTPGVCTRVFPDNSFDGHRYYYAQNENKTVTWTADNGVEACIDPHNEFTIAHADSTSACPSPYVRQKFHFFSDNDPLSLTSADAPAAPAGPASGGRPGSCLGMRNDTNRMITVRVDGWAATWVWQPGQQSYTSFNDVEIKSQRADGGFNVRAVSGIVLSPATATWTFHEEWTGSSRNPGTCNGTWLLTIHD